MGGEGRVSRTPGDSRLETTAISFREQTGPFSPLNTNALENRERDGSLGTETENSPPCCMQTASTHQTPL